MHMQFLFIAIYLRHATAVSQITFDRIYYMTGTTYSEHINKIMNIYTYATRVNTNIQGAPRCTTDVPRQSLILLRIKKI